MHTDGGIIVPLRRRWKRMDTDAVALRLAGHSDNLPLPARVFARLVSAYLRSPIRVLADETIASWLLDIVLDRHMRLLAFAALGSELSARFRADAGPLTTMSSGWRGNLLVIACWLLSGAVIFAGYLAIVA